MVAVKYCRKEALDVVIRDTRIDIETVDNQNRKLEEVIGVAVNDSNQLDKNDILDCLMRHRQWRREEEGRRDSMEEEKIVNELRGHEDAVHCVVR